MGTATLNDTRTASPAGLAIRGLSKHFGGVTALHSVELDVEPGSITALIGPNGAGKTTFFDIVSGLQEESSGNVMLDGVDITSWSPERRSLSGMSRTFQRVELFGHMNCLENVVSVLLGHTESSALAGIGRRPTMATVDYANELLAWAGIQDRAQQAPDQLPYGDQRRLELVRALATAPRILLLDEPAAGMLPGEVDALMVLIRRINALGITVFVVEHNMRMVMSLASWVVVLNFGQLIASGPPEQVQDDPSVIAAYLGVEQ